MSNHDEAEKLFTAGEPELVTVDIEKGPLPAVMREALTWMRANGVSECEMPGLGKIVFRAVAPVHPQPATGPVDLEPPADEKPPAKGFTVIGGFDPETLFAHVK